MKAATLLLYLLCATPFLYAQRSYRDSLVRLLSKAKEDTAKVGLLQRLSASYYTNPDSVFFYGQQGLKLAQALDYEKGEINCKQSIAQYWWLVGDYTTAIKLNYTVLDYARSHNDTLLTLFSYGNLANNYRDQGDYREALRLMFQINKSVQQYRNCWGCGIYNANIGSMYYGLNRFDSALFYLEKAVTYPKIIGYGWILLMTGRTLSRVDNSNDAFEHYRHSIRVLSQENDLKDLAGAYNSLADLFEETGHHDSAIYYGKAGLRIGQQKNYSNEILQSYLLLSKSYEATDIKNALAYHKLATVAKDDLFNQEKQRQIVSYTFNEELRQNGLKNAILQHKNRNRIYILVALLTGLLLFVILLVRNNKRKQKVNELLKQQKQEVEQALAQLKQTQAQLVQREKMASLGELTAGIAHEIQNPLNFVNNFSEVSTELVQELKTELQQDNKAVAVSLASDIEQNLEKIKHHGSRADAIVKGMLQHSRASSGQKEQTDINALADEYLRLSYHGLRAKDKSFDAAIETHFDENIGRLNIVPQEIGRVLLNLFNNAFYAVHEKMKKLGEGYKPTVSVSTRKLDDKVEISVADNGMGISKSSIDKIFQPFFTTKPSGEGTGLGLSISYDIIKAHGGELKAESQDGQGATFAIVLPISI